MGKKDPKICMGLTKKPVLVDPSQMATEDIALRQN